MRTLFIDTWGWINLFNRKEKYHQQVKKLYKEIRNKQGTIITTDYVLDEVYTLLFKRLSVELAIKAFEAISTAIENDYLNLVRITPERFEASQKLRLQFQDKPDISFTDLTSIAVMQELGITDILTGDAHFTHVGMNFVLFP